MAGVEAARRLGIAQVPVICITHLTPAQIKAYRLADKRLAEKAGWPKEMLQIEFAALEIEAVDFDLDVTGLSFPEIDGYLTLDASNASADADAMLLAPERTAFSRLGDLWLCGDHRLLCGSTLKAARVDRVTGTGIANVIFTDPVWNISRKVIGGKHPDFVMGAGQWTDEQYQRSSSNASRI